MKLHFKDTEISFTPMMSPEIYYWLSRGYKIFTHRGINWMRVLHADGHRIMIMAPGEELERIDTRIFERVGMVTRMKK
jgi:hypothetical protein